MSELESPQSPVEDPLAQVKNSKATVENPQKTVSEPHSEPKREQSPVEDSPSRPENPQSPVNDPEPHIEDPESEHDSDNCNEAVEVFFYSALDSNLDGRETALSDHNEAYCSRQLLVHGKKQKAFGNWKKEYLSLDPDPNTPSTTERENAANGAFGSRLWKLVNIARFVDLLPVYDFS